MNAQRIRDLLDQLRASAHAMRVLDSADFAAGMEHAADELEAELEADTAELLAYFCPARSAAQNELPPPVGVQYPLEVSV